jgi:hypothetical protein
MVILTRARKWRLNLQDQDPMLVWGGSRDVGGLVHLSRLGRLERRGSSKIRRGPISKH